MVERSGLMELGHLEFLERCASAQTRSDIGVAFMAEAERLGFRYAAIGANFDPDVPSIQVVFTNYPRAWVEQYLTLNYVRLDPVLSRALRSHQPFRWADPQFTAGFSAHQKAMFEEARGYGIELGLSVPARIIGRRAACGSVVPPPEGVDPRAYLLAQSAVLIAHEAMNRTIEPAASPRPALTPRERECLQLVANGKSDWSISEILGVSERTVHHTIERAKRRYGVSTRVQAVVRALVAGEIMAE